MDDKETVKIVGVAKRVFTGDNKISFAGDKISRDEAKLFAGDEFLVNQIMKKREIDREIVEYIENTLKENRKSLNDEEIRRVEGAITYLNQAIRLLDGMEFEGLIDGLNQVRDALLKRME